MPPGVRGPSIRSLLLLGNSKQAEPVDSPTNEPALVSGDVAADLVTPWAAPARATIYARAGVDLGDVGQTPCPAPDATLVLVTPQDPGPWRFLPHVWRLVATDPAPRQLPIADPLQILWDVERSPSVDADQMSSRLEDLVTRVRTASENDATAGWSSRERCSDRAHGRTDWSWRCSTGSPTWSPPPGVAAGEWTPRGSRLDASRLLYRYFAQAGASGPRAANPGLEAAGTHSLPPRCGRCPAPFPRSVMIRIKIGAKS